MNSNHFQNGIKAYATQAIGQSNINAKSLSAYKIPLPDLDTQRRIVAQIEEEQALVEGNKKLIALFERKIAEAIATVWGSGEG
jgi:type I restriction enzyme M protein